MKSPYAPTEQGQVRAAAPERLQLRGGRRLLDLRQRGVAQVDGAPPQEAAQVALLCDNGWRFFNKAVK
jgi:hypothetical protein